MHDVSSWRRVVQDFFEMKYLTSIACEFHFPSMLYILLCSSLTPCNPRLARNSWKPDKTSSYETRSGIRGAGTNPTIWGARSRSGCIRVSTTRFATLMEEVDTVNLSPLEQSWWWKRFTCCKRTCCLGSGHYREMWKSKICKFKRLKLLDLTWWIFVFVFESSWSDEFKITRTDESENERAWDHGKHVN